MSILNRTNDGSAPCLLVLWRALRELAPMEKGRLINLCAPKSIVRDKGVAQTLTRWTQLGLFEEKGGKVYLAQAVAKVKKEDGPEYRGFRREVRRLALLKENNEDFAKAVSKGAGDFTLAAAWVLSTDVFAGHFLGSAKEVMTFSDSQTEARRADNGQEKRVVHNDTRWSGFKDWAVFLGFGRTPSKSEFWADATEAIDDELDEAIPKTRTPIAVQDFVREIGKRIPVLDGGEYAVQARTRAKDAWRPIKDTEISPALTLALLRLERAKRIDFEHKADANFRVLLGPGLVDMNRRVSHIRRLTRGT